MSRRSLVEPDSTSAEPFRALRLAIETKRRTTETTGLVVTSPRRFDGRSTIAANYAVVTALIQRPVLLIDADMRNPSLHEIFDRPRAPGLVDVLRGGLDLHEVAHSFPGLGGLQVLTSGSQAPSPGDVAASPAMGELLQRAYEQYEAVVIDSPAALSAADAFGLASHTGTDVVIVVNGAAKRRHVMSALRKLVQTEANVLGLVVNREGALAAGFGS
jgi:capsular exopolysaccharide synthesis family protein